MTAEQQALLKRLEQSPDDRIAHGVYADWLDENGYPAEAIVHRARMNPPSATGEELPAPDWGDKFAQYEISRGDDPDGHENSGYVACAWIEAGIPVATLFSFSHCSCNGTWDDSGPRKWFWVGTQDELVGMAIRNADPVIPSRTISKDDFDARKWGDLYAGVIAWDERGRGAAINANP